MASEPSAQRLYRAACPNCGAPVEFRSAAAPFAVCSFCRSTVVRAGGELRKIGESAEVFDDHSPIQLGASGTHLGARFTVVGRLQYRYADGTWNEWHALFDSGPELTKSGWLSDDNGRYVVAFDAPLKTPVPPAEQLQPGAPLTVNDERWTVASVVAAKLIAAQGELPKRPMLDKGFVVADLRSSRDEVGTLDYSEPQRPGWSVGRSVQLSALAMTGLAEGGEAAAKGVSGRTLACPNCGAALIVKLETTQSIVCHQCKAVVDISRGVGGDLAHYQQAVGREPLIPLGTIGTIALGTQEALPWQVVGYVERCEVAESDEDEETFWREYLLYHRGEGFAFLVDAEDGWSSAIPITGAPESAGDGAKWQGVVYRKLYDYTGRVTFVLGEFYWKLVRDQRTRNSDFQGTGAAADRKLNRERTSGEGVEEVVWSAGAALPADAVMSAFRIPTEQLAAFSRDSLPTAFNASSKLAKVILWVFIAFVVLILFRCGSGGGGAADCNQVRSSFGEASQEYQQCLNDRRSGGGFRTGGGSFGGYSSGGGHK